MYFSGLGEIYISLDKDIDTPGLSRELDQTVRRSSLRQSQQMPRACMRVGVDCALEASS